MRYLLLRFPNGSVQTYGPFVNTSAEAEKQALHAVAKTTQKYFGGVVDFYELEPLDNMKATKLEWTSPASSD